MKKTIMIIGGGLLQVPVITTAKKMGLQTIVTDYNPNTPGMKDADIPIIMSTRDIEGSVRVAKAQNDITPIHAVVTVGTDASMTVAAVASALNLPGIKFEDAEAATNKIKMRMRFQEHGVPSPNFLPVWSLSDAKKACKILGFPLVIKPSDNMGARGVTRVDNFNQIADAFQHAKSASPSGELIIENYMEGHELSIDAIISNNEITFTGIADRIIEREPFFIETGHTMPSQQSQKIIDDACAVMTKGIRALGITTGAAKGDIKITKNGAMIGELAARLSGGFMSAYTYPLHSGVDLMKAAVEVALGQEPGNLEPVINNVSIERAIITKPGIVKKINNLEEAFQVPGIKHIFLNIQPGDKILEPKSNVEKAGHIIAVGKSVAEAEKQVEECRKILDIEIIENSSLTLDIINTYAREKFKKVCYACRSCSGNDCPTGIPGMGGSGDGTSFRQNLESLKKYKIKTRLIHDVTAPDTSCTFYGTTLSLPVMAAPITGTVTNMGGAIDELNYNQAVISGSIRSNTIAFVGDGAGPEKYKIGLQALSEYTGRGIPVFKPRSDNNEIIKRIKAAEDAGAMAVGIDIDACTLKTMSLKNQPVAPKSPKELQQLIKATPLPVILKGIMHTADAEIAVECGADAIIISNHGGRVLEEMPGAMDVIEEITDSVKGKIKILIDGGFRSGEDIIKALAMGADYVLIGRPVAIAAVGMGADGVSFYFNTIREQLEKVMILTGCNTINDINKNIIQKK